jgi:hypothetical protein
VIDHNDDSNEEENQVEGPQTVIFDGRRAKTICAKTEALRNPMYFSDQSNPVKPDATVATSTDDQDRLQQPINPSAMGRADIFGTASGTNNTHRDPLFQKQIPICYSAPGAALALVGFKILTFHSEG